MARIVYSCCGEGRGHSSRTLTIARKLQQLGHEVRILASHAAFSALNGVFSNVTEIPGLVLAYSNNRVQVGASISRNWATWKRKSAALVPIQAMLKEFRPTLAITDFEPFLPIAAKALKIPFISLDHQHVIPGLSLRPPPRYWLHFLATLGIVHLTHRGERANLVTSFFHSPKPFRPNYHYFGPILREEIQKLRPTSEKHVLVYQTSSSFDNLSDILAKVPVEFRIYAFNRVGTVGNCVYKPRNHPNFLDDLANCAWVLTNGGYTLISESLALGKPVLSIPVSGQFEQWINAHYLEKMGLGIASEREQFGPETIRNFQPGLESFRKKIRGKHFDGTEDVLRKVCSYL